MYNNVLAAVDSKCNIRFVLSVVQEYVVSDSTVFFSTCTQVSTYGLSRNDKCIKRQEAGLVGIISAYFHQLI